MAKIKSGQLAGAQGKVGSVVYQKSASGDTVARQYVVPKNPKTLTQRGLSFPQNVNFVNCKLLGISPTPAKFIQESRGMS
jgi:hypothetical protein